MDTEKKEVEDIQRKKEIRKKEGLGEDYEGEGIQRQGE